MVIETRRDNGTLVIRAEDRLDLANAQVFHDELDAAIESSERAVVIDMSGLTYISSAGLRVIIQMLRRLQRQDARLALCSLSTEVQNVFDTSGIGRLVDIQPSRAEAIAAVSG
ncbi:MAG: STAS domain-containing protein [Chloroflexi bacterium]|nr:STAS domain-containing protein [Chloroflexota bacterium]